MNVYITKINGMSYRSTEQYAQRMTAATAHTLGIREMGIYRYDTEGESAESRQKRIDGIIAGIGAGDIVICQFPTWNGLEFERALVRHIKAYHGRIMIFIHDLEAMMCKGRRSELEDTVGLYNEAEVLIVPSDAMKHFLIGQGIRAGMRFIVQEMWDHTTQSDLLGQGRLKREIHLAGDPAGVCFPRIWDYDVPLKVYSDRVCQGDRVQRMGWMSSDRLLLELSKGGFGLVWYGDEAWRGYLAMAGSRKIGMYLAAGIPVIVPRGIADQCLIEEDHLGLIVDTLDEAAEFVEDITEQEYQGYAASVARFAPLLREGSFTKKCLVDALHMSMRKDLYVYSGSDKTCVLSECAFGYVCLREAYGDALALSWTFRGEAEGFLVYDADSGKLAGEIFNGLGHYLLLKKYPREARFIVKAYIRAVRGKLIVAESGAAALSERYPARIAVSLIIPAFNAEGSIARSIDTALAQSFTDMEIVVVNDGSTDRTQEIVDWYKERYPQVRSLYQENAGQASARNAGVGCANGDHIAFMDSDDMLRPNMIERSYDAILKNACDIAMAPAYQITDEGYGVVGAYPLEEDTAIPVDDFFVHYIRYAYPVVWNKLYKKSLVEKHPIPAVTYEDSAWTPYVLSYAAHICYIDEPLYEYDRTIRNVTYIHSSYGKTAEKQYTDRREYVMFFLDNGNPQKKDLLKKLALGYAVGFVQAFSFPKFEGLLKEIERS